MKGSLLRMFICFYPLTNIATIGNSCFWLVDKKSSVESLGQMNQNLVGSIYGRSSIKIAHFVLIYKQTWPPCNNSWFSFETIWPNKAMWHSQK